MKIGEFFLALGFDVDDKKLKDFDGQITEVKNNLFGAKEYALAAAYGISKFIDSTVGKVADMKAFSDQTGLSVDELQRWQNVASQLNRNLTPETVTSSINNLQKIITQFQRFGEGNVIPFKAFGIDISDSSTNAYTALQKIRENIGKYDKPTRTNLISQLGLDPNFVSLLTVSNEQFEKLAANLGLTADQTGKLDDLGQKLAQIEAHATNLKDVFVADLAPSIFQLIDALKTLGGILNDTVIASFRSLMKAMSDNESTLGLVYKIILGIGAAFALWASPILATVAAVSALIFVMNELFKMIQGKDNIFSEAFSWSADKLQGIKDWLKDPKNTDPYYADKHPLADQDATNGAASNSTTNKTQTVNNHFDVKSSADPLTVSQSIYDQFANTFKQLNNGFAN